jgi:hypothetical protein
VTGVDITDNRRAERHGVEVKVKPRVGATHGIDGALTNCDTQGNCSATATFNLSAGAVRGRGARDLQVQ